MAETMAEKVKLSIYLAPEVNLRLRRERADNPGTSVSEIIETLLRERYAEMDRRGRKARA